jgi:hypothetical protein
MSAGFNGNGYPVYHSIYDNYRWMEKFGKPPRNLSPTCLSADEDSSSRGGQGILASIGTLWPNDCLIPCCTRQR